jgi:hypothetical protein
MGPKTLPEKIVDEYHNFDIWRQITNVISTEVGDLNNLPEELNETYRAAEQITDPTEHIEDLTTAIKETYNSTQKRLRHLLVKSIGMS